MPSLFVVGRLPPPLDGQTIATERLCTLLDGSYAVRRVNTSVRETALQPTEARLRPARALQYLRQTRHLSDALASAPQAPVLWASVSPHPLGHLRDVWATWPAFGPQQSVVAVSHRAYFERMFRSPLTRSSALRLVDRLQAVVFLSEGIAERAAPWVPAAKRLVVPNTVGDDVLFSHAEVSEKRARVAGRPGLSLLFLANMMPEKGYMDALEALNRLHTRGVAASLTLIGRWLADADRAAFEVTVERLGLGAHVHHRGGVSDRRVIREALLAADVLVFPSYHPSEAQPVAVIEALGAGVPVVAVSQGGLPEMIRDGHGGFLVGARRPDEIAGAVERLVPLDRWTEASRQARARFDATFAPDVVRSRWLGLLARLPAR